MSNQISPIGGPAYTPQYATIALIVSFVGALLFGIATRDVWFPGMINSSSSAKPQATNKP